MTAIPFCYASRHRHVPKVFFPFPSFLATWLGFFSRESSLRYGSRRKKKKGAFGMRCTFVKRKKKKKGKGVSQYFLFFIFSQAPDYYAGMLAVWVTFSAKKKRRRENVVSGSAFFARMLLSLVLREKNNSPRVKKKIRGISFLFRENGWGRKVPCFDFPAEIDDKKGNFRFPQNNLCNFLPIFRFWRVFPPPKWGKEGRGIISWNFEPRYSSSFCFTHLLLLSNLSQLPRSYNYS